MAFSYSVMLDLSGRNVLVIGGGKVATRKIHRVLKAGACVTVIAPELCEDLSKLLQRHALQYEQRAFQLDDIGVYAPFLVFAATNDSGLNKRIAEYCNENNILVNSITEPKMVISRFSLNRKKNIMLFLFRLLAKGLAFQRHCVSILNLCWMNDWIWL